jgi:hypothetical protein
MTTMMMMMMLIFVVGISIGISVILFPWPFCQKESFLAPPPPGCDSVVATPFPKMQQQQQQKTLNRTKEIIDAPDVSQMSFVDAHNALRAKMKIPPLVVDHRIEASARDWNLQQCQQGIYDHPRIVKYTQSLAIGKNMTPGQATRAWFDEVGAFAAACPTLDDACVQTFMAKHYGREPEVGHFMNLASVKSTALGCDAYVCRNPESKYDGLTYNTCEYNGTRAFVPTSAVAAVL